MASLMASPLSPLRHLVTRYRERMQVLVQYCDANHLPRDLKANMQARGD